MRRLKRRIAATGTVAARAKGDYHPYGTPATPMTMPLSLVIYTPGTHYPSGTLTYEDVHPIWAPDGAIISAMAPSPAVNVHAAGRL
jgi:hypothetical protein